MTADDPQARPGPPRPPTGAVAAWRRPDGGWQVGVGPGAVVLHLDAAEGGGGPADAGGAGRAGTGGGRGHGGGAMATGNVLGPALAGPRPTEPGRPGRAEEEPPSCAVVGVGPLAARLRRLLGESSTEAGGPVQLVVHQHVVPPDVGVAVARSGRPTVPVVAQRRRVLVGPVVGLGAGPCLHCLDLQRRDRDNAWPALATALGHPAEQLVPLDLPEPLARAAEGLVLLLVSSVRAGGSVSTGLGYELGPAAPHVVARRWSTHPACPWHP